ncbi:helix-turn-helix domain-containing protein [Flavobacterium sp.]|uniref:helix-turn-helix domain-containing protein n=1 Tax=Flavobacterium sp. TaxID=239 RepID=UPI0025DBD221|nr:helix-turn-helix domain-containing protein [Flavobacterium sp.]
MENPNYYAIIPAEVRYDENLSPNAKLLFAEITCLCNKNGVCNASNKYFSDLYKVSTVSISKWVAQLIRNGYIETKMIYKDGSKEIQNRNIKLLVGVKENFDTPIKEKFKDNNNITINSNIDDIDFQSLLLVFNKITGKKMKVMNEKAKKQFRARLRDGYSKQEIMKAIKNCFDDDFHKANPKYLTPEFISRPDKFEKYVNIDGHDDSKEDAALRKRKELLKSMGI